MATILSGMITSKNIIDIAGISRATLNNYIKFGILPRPIVGPPRPGDRGVKQIGYFPKEVLARLEQIKLLKSQGKSMEDIVAQLTGIKTIAEQKGSSAQAAKVSSKDEASAARDPERYSRISDSSRRVTIGDIESPAYLVNRNFEVEWINQQAEDLVFGKKVSGIADVESRNIFRLFFDRRQSVQIDTWTTLTALHLAALKENINEQILSRLFRDISDHESDLLHEIYRSILGAAGSGGGFHPPVTLFPPSSISRNFRVHTIAFREGTFFVYLPDDKSNEELLAMLSHREQLICDLLGRRLPSLVSLCALVADLQDAGRISAELLPAQYFELINGIWESAAPSFDANKAVYGKRVGDGVLYYFIDKPGENYIINCINCTIELRESMKKISEKWKNLKGWDNNLYLNTGINEGREFFGTIHSAGTVEFLALGDTANIASRLSEFAKNGEIWTTKNLVSKMTQEDRNRYSYGVRSKTRPGNGFARDSFARLKDLLHESNPRYRQLSAIGGLSITEIKERIHHDNS